MDNFDYLCKFIILGDCGVGKSTLEDYLDLISPINQRASIRDQIKDVKNRIDEYHIMRESSNSISRRLYYLLLIKRKIKKKERYLKYLESQLSTRSVLGVSFQKKIVEIRGNRVKLQIWVLGGQERFRRIRKMYVRGSSGAILMYDITNALSLSRIHEWREMIAEHCGEIPIALIGNKLDLEEQRTVSKEKGIEVRKNNNLSSFMEISAETGENVEKMFELIGESILN